MIHRFSFCIAALLCLSTSILAAPPLQLSSSSTTGTSLVLPVNSSLTLGAAPLPPYPPPDPLAYQVPNSPIILVFSKYLAQSRAETWVQIAVNSALSECSQHPRSEPLQNQVYTWRYKGADLEVRPAAEEGAPRRLTWVFWASALDGISDFLRKYDQRSGFGLRMNFEILVSSEIRTVEGQYAIGKGFLDVI